MCLTSCLPSRHVAGVRGRTRGPAAGQSGGHPGDGAPGPARPVRRRQPGRPDHVRRGRPAVGHQPGAGLAPQAPARQVRFRRTRRPTNGRDRPWRMVPSSANSPAARDDPHRAAAADLLQQVMAERALANLLAWQERRDDHWRDVTGVSQNLIYLTRPELARSIDALLAPADRPAPGGRPGGAAGGRGAGRRHPPAGVSAPADRIGQPRRCAGRGRRPAVRRDRPAAVPVPVGVTRPVAGRRADRPGRTARGRVFGAVAAMSAGTSLVGIAVAACSAACR
jgi:hypothetical protein